MTSLGRLVIYAIKLFLYLLIIIESKIIVEAPIYKYKNVIKYIKL